jgi:bud site selection protein 31
MPKEERKRKRVPEGFEVLEERLQKYRDDLRDACNTSDDDGKRKNEALWPIFKLHHGRSRYVYEMYREHKISREVYEYCLRNKHADGALIAKWKKQGYERLCCLRCIQPKDTNFGTTCLCRVPSKSLEAGRVVECINCGCKGCATGG